MIKSFNEYNEYNSESKVSIQQDIESIMSDTMAYLLDDNINRNDEELVEARIVRIQNGSFRTNGRSVYHIYIAFNTDRLWSEIGDYVMMFIEVLSDKYELRREFESSPDTDVTMSIKSEYGGGTFYLNSKDITSGKKLPNKLVESPISHIRLAVIN